jgi:hypothetical protein
MTAGTTSRTAHLLAVMNKGDGLRPVSRGTAGDQSPAIRPGLLSRLLSRSLAVGTDHAICVMPAHPVRQQARKAHGATVQISRGG